MFRIALAQINLTVGDLEGNQKRILEYVRRAKAVHADCVVFPELAVTGYPPEDLLLKEHFVADNYKTIQTIAGQINGIVAIVGFSDRDKEKNIYNAAAVIADGKIQGIYHKEALPNYGVFDEKRYFLPGQDNKAFLIAGVTVGINICEDIWIKDGPYKKQAEKGVKVLINLSSSPFELGKFETREKLLQARAKETKAYVCYTNLVGGQDELIFDGGSLIVDPQGKTIGLGKMFEEDLVVVDLDVASSAKKTASNVTSVSVALENPKRSPMRNHIVKSLPQNERIYKALVLGTRDYMSKNGFKKTVIGLSGGIDSALVAAIAVEAVGQENVVALTMPSRFTSQETYSDAKELAYRLGIKLIDIPIEAVHKAFLGALEKEFAETDSGLAEENLQARIRGTMIMALSNKFGWLVLTTGNKSEVAVGYCTLYGDMSGGFAVIKDLSKTQVYEVSRLINNKGKELIPQSTIDRAPTAELKENQKDQDSLPPYDTLDEILKEYVEEHRSLPAMAKKNDPGMIKKVMRMVDLSEYKRRQAPPGIKISARAFGKDWRLPITNKYKEFER